MSATQTAYKVIGTRPIRHDGMDKVTGRALYGADVKPTGMLYGRILRSPHAHARIKSLDTSAAAKLPGVKAVVTGRDLPKLADKQADFGEGGINLRDLATNILAAGKVLYHGHAVAAVAATSAHIAEEALALIKVEYESLPCVLTADGAMKPDAPLLHADLKTKSLGQETDKVSNVASHHQLKKGDIEQGFAKADVVVAREFRTATVHQGYIEPQNATAQWSADGSVTIWCSTQGAFAVRDQVAELLAMPVSKIKVVPMEIGGGFGGKIQVYLEPVAALLSKKSGKPVQLTMNRAEVFMGTGPTSGSYIKCKMGATKDGRLIAAYAHLAYEAGAFPGSPVGAGAMCIFAPYNIENVLIDAYDVVCNKPRTSAYRAPGATNAAFTSETIMDELCEKLKIDPLEFRVKNGAKEGDIRADGPKHAKIGYIVTVEAAKKHAHYSAPIHPHPNPLPQAGEGKGLKYGRGVASGFWMNWGGQSSVTITPNPDGTVSLVEGSTDIGGTRASIAMQAAEVLGLPAESVKPTVADTDSIGYNDVTGGSRTTFGSGWAAYEAANDLLRQMIERAAKVLEVASADIEYKNTEFINKKDAAKKLTFIEVVKKCGETGGPVVGRATVHPQKVGVGFATHIVDVAVDAETGKVDILRYTATQDVGTAIHPSYVEGQMQGGVAQGIGWALNEEYFYDENGHLLNASFLDYRMPTALDLPMIDTVIVEVPNPGHPYGVRGVGEVPIVPPPAAIANAIHRAIGVRMSVLPMSPRRILESMDII